MRHSPIDNVDELNSKMNNGEDCLVWFYAEWCGHCKNMEETWEKLYKKNANQFNMFKISDLNQHKVDNNLGAKVQGFPTIMAVSNKKPSNIHKDERTFGSLNSFLINNVNRNNNNNNNNNNIVECPTDKVDDLNEKISNNEDCLVWFYAEWCGHCQDMKDIWNTFYSEHKDTHNIYKISDLKKDQVMNHLSENVNGYPTIMAISNGEEKRLFEGDRSVDNFSKFLNDNVEPCEDNSVENTLNNRLKKSRKNNVHSMNSANLVKMLTPPRINNSNNNANRMVKKMKSKTTNNMVNPINNSELEHILKLLKGNNNNNNNRGNNNNNNNNRGNNNNNNNNRGNNNNNNNNLGNNNNNDNMINLTKLFNNSKQNSEFNNLANLLHNNGNPINLEEVNLNTAEPCNRNNNTRNNNTINNSNINNINRSLKSLLNTIIKLKEEETKLKLMRKNSNKRNRKHGRVPSKGNVGRKRRKRTLKRKRKRT